MLSSTSRLPFFKKPDEYRLTLGERGFDTNLPELHRERLWLGDQDRRPVAVTV